MKKTLVVFGLTAALVLLPGCSRTATKEGSSDVSVKGALSAVSFTVTLGNIGKIAIIREPTLLGIYVNILLADGLSVPVSAAQAGITAVQKITAPASEQNLDNTYELLEEFAAILHVNVSDLLNRSPERALTLDEYLTGLQNITERSRRRNEDLGQQIKELKVEERDRRKEQSTIEREVRDAVKAKDFATAGARQRELIAAQERVTRVSFQLKEVTQLQKTFTELLTIADERVKAIESNREILIAGLRAVNVPGVEDLNVIEGGTTRRNRGGSFGTF